MAKWLPHSYLRVALHMRGSMGKSTEPLKTLQYGTAETLTREGLALHRFECRRMQKHPRPFYELRELTGRLRCLR